MWYNGCMGRLGPYELDTIVVGDCLDVLADAFTIDGELARIKPLVRHHDLRTKERIGDG